MASATLAGITHAARQTVREIGKELG